MATENPIILPAEFHEVTTVCAATEVVTGGRSVIGIDDARKLHQGLGVGRDYVTWIKGRIDQYGFRDGVDFEVVDDLRSPVSGSAKSVAVAAAVFVRLA